MTFRLMNMRHSLRITILAVLAILILLPGIASAHNVSKRDATFVQANKGAAVAPFLYLGAKHMVTGYDHLLFLVGVIFFLYRLKDVVQYVSLFTLGHSLTLLAGVLGGIRVNSYAVDAIIAQTCERHGATFVTLNGFYAVNDFHASDGGSSYLGRTDWFHPGDQGHAAIAAAVLSALGAGPAPVVGPLPSASQIPDVIRTRPQ